MRRGFTALLAAGCTVAALLLSTSPAGAAAGGERDATTAPGRRCGRRRTPWCSTATGCTDARSGCTDGDRALGTPRGRLTARADDWLRQGPWTVLDKPQTPPGGDEHDYLSQAPYWWPTQPTTADNPWGCPYVQKRRSAQPRRRRHHRPRRTRRDVRLRRTTSPWPGTTPARPPTPQGRADPAHLVPRPGHADEPEPRPRASSSPAGPTAGHRHHRLLPAVHRRPRRTRRPRHRRRRLDARRTTPGWRAGTRSSCSWLTDSTSPPTRRAAATTTAPSSTCRSPRSTRDRPRRPGAHDRR